jgi:hypothetical protein
MADEKKAPKEEDQPAKAPQEDEPEVLDDGEDEKDRSVKQCCSTGGNPLR